MFVSLGVTIDLCIANAKFFPCSTVPTKQFASLLNHTFLILLSFSCLKSWIIIGKALGIRNLLQVIRLLFLLHFFLRDRWCKCELGLWNGTKDALLGRNRSKRKWFWLMVGWRCIESALP